MTDVPWREEISYRFGNYVHEVLDWVRCTTNLAIPGCITATHPKGRAREIDDYSHTKFWWWFLWPITLPLTGLAFILWVVAVLAIYAVLIPLALGCLPIHGALYLRRRIVSASAQTRPASNA